MLNKYINGTMEYSKAMTIYKIASHRHKYTNYDKLWDITQAERERKARIMVESFNIEFTQALKQVDKAYKPLLREQAKAI